MEAHFLQADGGQRLLVCHAAKGVRRGGVVYVPPFAEEMNKSRRMATLQARALAAQGWTVALPDLAGCGDSSGEFGDATWQAWIDDVARCVRWLRERGDGPIWLWGLRLGCLLAAEVARSDASLRKLLFWQPPASGKALLQQFLRLRMAGALEQGAHRGVVDMLRAQLAAGETVEVAGYEVAPALAHAIGAASGEPPGGPGVLVWREVVPDAEQDGLSPAGAPLRDRWSRAGWQLDAGARSGPAFWQTTEIESVASLIEGELPLAPDAS